MKSTLPLRSKPHAAIIHKIADLILEVGKNKIAFIILFGSFARGNWVRDIYQEGHATYDYASDYDFLIITKTKQQGSGINALNLKRKIESELEKKGLVREFLCGHNHSATLVIEPLERFDAEIKKKQYFFSDIKKEGILLYDSGEFEIAEPKELNEEERRKIALEDYQHWMEKGLEFLTDCSNATQRGAYSNAAFYLHQAAESFYNCFALVFTGYKPKTHDLLDLEKYCSAHCPQLLAIFLKPKKGEKIRNLKSKKHRLASKEYLEQLYGSSNQASWFELLRIAYIEARYNKHYQIRPEQLEYLILRVGKLKDLVASECKQHVSSKNEK